MQPIQGRCIHKLPPLKKGDRIGAVAPASPFDTDRFLSGVQVLNAMGFEVVWQEGLFGREGYLAGADENRLAMLHAFFIDPEIAAVWCARGGYGSMRLLTHLDLHLMGSRPKPFIGSSDITALLNFLWQQCGIPAFHGPMIAALGDADEKTIRFLASALTGSKPLSIQAENPETIVPGAATGPVAGGNLSTLSHLLGTPFFPDLSGAIVFLEDIGEKPYRIDRMLTQLLYSGRLDRVAGICLGTFSNCGDIAAVNSTIRERLQSMTVPVVSGFPAGHGMPCLTLPLGVEATLDGDNGRLCYTDSAFK